MAAITDHAGWAKILFGLANAPGAIGIDAHAWARTRQLADQADDPGGFVALAGFEWSHGLHGHMNVWGTQRFSDALGTFGPCMAAFWRWLEGPGEDGLATVNHPGQAGPRRFGRFHYRAAMARRPLRVELDLDRGAAWWGRRLNVQVLRRGPAAGARLAEREARRLPALAAAVEVTLPSPEEPVVSCEVDVDPTGGPWLVLRVSDPAAPPDPRARGPWAELGDAIAYPSPVWLETG